ncbi:MAG: hypothetical protein V8S27_09090 [Lachnospiraceae bacterium]
MAAAFGGHVKHSILFAGVKVEPGARWRMLLLWAGPSLSRCCGKHCIVRKMW